jgi:glycosyltransferase involved in cell wall biosynthesis
MSAPLVSVIVRTVGRDTLARTLECVDRQTWRPIEAVVVRARDVALPPLEASIPIRVVGNGGLPRPAAANVGLQAAHGEWIVFLDEDDLHDRDHVESLVAAAQAAALPVAYSQTRLADTQGNTQRIFGGPFHRELLRRSNYLFMGAVLFHRRFADAGLRFDETFPMFEDWDFWLQLAERCDFAFTGRPTATWFAESGQSGAGSGANLDREALLFHRNRLMRKWGLA